MAEETEKQAASKKRRLRTNTETVRERSEKHQLRAATPEKPKRFKTFMSGFFWPLRSLGRLVGRLGQFKIFRIIGYILLPKYLRSSWKELRLVEWTGRRQTWRLTFAVIVFSVVFGLVVYGVDTVLDKLFKELILE